MELFTFQNFSALVTLSVMEIILGIDNIVMLSVMTNKLPKGQRATGRRVGLFLAMVMRIGLLCTLSFIMTLTKPLLIVLAVSITGRDLVLFGGGLFLLVKATMEIHDSVETPPRKEEAQKLINFAAVIVQVGIMDMVFSLDSVITAVGMSQNLIIMITAIILAMVIMLLCAGSISQFIEKHPSVKILALSFLMLIGVMLVMESIGKHIDRGYIYFAMAFSFFVEVMNLRRRSRIAKIAHSPH